MQQNTMPVPDARSRKPMQLLPEITLWLFVRMIAIGFVLFGGTDDFADYDDQANHSHLLSRLKSARAFVGKISLSMKSQRLIQPLFSN